MASKTAIFSERAVQSASHSASICCVVVPLDLLCAPPSPTLCCGGSASHTLLLLPSPLRLPQVGYVISCVIYMYIATVTANTGWIYGPINGLFIKSKNVIWNLVDFVSCVCTTHVLGSDYTCNLYYILVQ